MSNDAYIPGSGMASKSEKTIKKTKYTRQQNINAQMEGYKNAAEKASIEGAVKKPHRATKSK